MADAPSPSSSPVPRPRRGAVTLVAAPIIALVIASYVGDALAPSLVDSHPALLIALNARNRNLILATNSLDAWTFYAIGFARLMVADPPFYLLGRWYGDAAVRWAERRTRTYGQLLRNGERLFARAGYPLVAVAPNNYVCLFAGAAGMPVAGFMAANVAGTFVRLYLIRRFGAAFEKPLDGLVEWIGDHRVLLLVVTVATVVASIALEARRGETEIESLTHLEDELDALDQDDSRPSDNERGGQS